MVWKQFLVVVALCGITLSGFSQESERTKSDVKNLVKLNFDGLFEGRYQFGYERLIGKYTTVQLNAGIIFDYELSESSTSVFAIDSRQLGVVLSPEVRVYLSEFTNDVAPKGFFVGSFARYRSYEDRRIITDGPVRDEDITNAFTVGGGLHLGFQYFTSFGVGFDAWIGPEFRFRSEDNTRRVTGTDTPPDFGSFSATRTRVQETVVYAGIGICYAF